MNVTAVPYTHDGNVFTVAMNRSFTCASVDPLHLNGSFPNTNGTLTILDAHVEAFGTKKKAEYSAGLLVDICICSKVYFEIWAKLNDSVT